MFIVALLEVWSHLNMHLTLFICSTNSRPVQNYYGNHCRLHQEFVAQQKRKNSNEMRIEDVGYFLWFFSNKSIFCVTYSFHHLSNRFSFYFRGVDFLSHYFFLKNCINLSFLSITLHSCICRYHFHVRQSSSIAVTTKDAHLLLKTT